MNRPTVCEVLTVIGDRGILVGSARDGSLDHKDVDVVIRDQRDLEGVYKTAKQGGQVFKDLLARFGPHCISEVCGHLVVKSSPPVEVFEGDIVMLATVKKVAKTYSTLLRQSKVLPMFGTQFRVWMEK